MNSFLNSLKDRLTAMAQEIRTLPGELDSIVTGFDRGKLRSLLLRLNQAYDQLLDELFAPQRSRVLASPFVRMPEPPFLRMITGEDLSRWRAAWKSDVWVVLGKEGVGLVAISGLSRKYDLKAPEMILAAQRQGYVVLGWDQYQELLNEIGKLIARAEEITGTTRPSDAMMGIPLPTTATNKTTKLLP